MLNRSTLRVTTLCGLVVIASLLSVGSTALAIDQENPPPPSGEPTSTPSVDPVAEGGTVSVSVTGVGTTAEGGSFPVARVQPVPRVCWYGRDRSGLAYYEYWKPDGVARRSSTLEAYAAQGLLYPGWDTAPIFTDTTGSWYGPECRPDAPSDYVTAYRAEHAPVYWWPADEVPASTEDVDPAVLAQVAYDFTDLPTGAIGWSPSLEGVGITVVNVDTWVWVAGAPTSVSVTASIPGTWARVDAVLDHVELSAPGAAPVTCDGPGIPWSAGATSASCSIRFTHSGADQPVKAGQSLPTSTLTVTAVWTASWVSSVNPTPTALPAQEITTTAEIPVAEIQTVVVSG